MVWRSEWEIVKSSNSTGHECKHCIRMQYENQSLMTSSKTGRRYKYVTQAISHTSITAAGKNTPSNSQMYAGPPTVSSPSQSTASM